MALAEIVVPTHVPAIVRDPDDDHVIACALAANASVIVSGDNDLLVLRHYRGIRIVTAKEASRIITT